MSGETTMGFIFNRIRQGFLKAKETAKIVATAARKNRGYIIAGVGLLAPMILAGPVLAIAGFSAAGPVAGALHPFCSAHSEVHVSLHTGSLAAAWQASIGSVAAGSLFAILQSAAMGGAGAAIVAAFVQISVVTVGAAVHRRMLLKLLASLRLVLQPEELTRLIATIVSQSRGPGPKGLGA